MIRKRTNRLFHTPDVTAFASVLLVLAFAFLIHRISPPPNVVASSQYVVHTQSAKVLNGAEREDAIVIVISRDGAVFFDLKRVANNDLQPLLEQRLRDRVERRAYLVVDPRARYAPVDEVLEAIRLAGIEDVSFVTRQSSKPD